MSYKRVEFMGLPGSGKTSSASLFLEAASVLSFHIQDASSVCRKALVAKDDGRIASVLKKFPTLIWGPLCGSQKTWSELHRFSFTHAELMAAVFRAMCDLKLPGNFRECITYDLFRCVTRHQLIDSFLARGEAVLFEEGFGQVGGLLTGYAPGGSIPEDLIGCYVQALPASLRAVIWIDTRPELCLERLRKRPAMTIGLDNKSDAECLQVLKQSKKAFEGLSREFTRRGIPVLHVQDNFADEQDAARAWSDQVSQVKHMVEVAG